MSGVHKMMNKVAIKFAVSGLALAVTMVACKPAAEASRPRAASATSVRAENEAARFYAKANEAVQKGNVSAALGFAEKAVELSPRDAGYRMLLGDLYLKNGRFKSAENAFTDVLTLDPGNARASLSLALSQIALGRSATALTHLDRLAQTAAPGDIGLAYALAGQPGRAIEMLEPAAREAGATGRVRQNLALSYALAGDWQKARTTAAQDVSPAELGPRMQQWASFAQASGSWDQVASLLGVRPVEDAGQPVRLALAASQPDVAYAAAEAPAIQPEAPSEAPVRFAAAEVPVPAPVVAAEPAAPAPVAMSAPAPVQFASAEVPVSAPMAEVPAPQSASPVPAEVVHAVQALVTPQATVMRASAPARTIRPTFAPAPRKASPRPSLASAAPGRFAVQIGAFSSATGAERAWAQAHRRFGLGDYQPRSTTINVNGKGTLHRLSVTGFQSHGDATRTCQSIRAKGGVCFVRVLAGDAPVRWASRYSGRRA